MTAYRYEQTYLRAMKMSEKDPNVTRMLHLWSTTQAYRELGIVKGNSTLLWNLTPVQAYRH